MSYESRQFDDCWDDLRSPATGLNPAGAAAPPTYDETELAASFSGSQVNLSGVIQHTPHGLDKSVPIHPHMHVFARVNPVTPKVAKWRLEYKMYSKDDVVPTAWTTINVDLTLTAENYNTSQIVDFGYIDITSLHGLASFFKFKISRQIAGATYTDPIFVDEFDSHVVFNRSGSAEEFEE